MPSRWLARLSDAWFLLRTLGVRARFLTGKASFVEADIRMTTNSVAELLDDGGKPCGERLLSHFQLLTRPPRTGRQGWELYAERVGRGTPHLSARLECRYCGHRFYVQVLSQVDPLSSEATGGRAPGRPASFSAEWFKFLHEDYEGEPSLNCPRCEQEGDPSVKFLFKPWA